MRVRIGQATHDVPHDSAFGAERFECDAGALLIAAKDGIDRLYFPDNGLVATMARLPAGATAGSGLIGAGGIVGYTALIGPTVASGDSIALSAMSGTSMSAVACRHGFVNDMALWNAMSLYASGKIAATEKLCACVALHSVEQRLARWLLQASTLLGADSIDITHRQLADVHGVRRASVTTSLHMIEGEQAIACQRQRVTVRDREKLTGLSCGCEFM